MLSVFGCKLPRHIALGSVQLLLQLVGLRFTLSKQIPEFRRLDSIGWLTTTGLHPQLQSLNYYLDA